ncbi:MAG: SprT family zinc-dependent metalloprotease [Veillonellales bacterium]
MQYITLFEHLLEYSVTYQKRRKTLRIKLLDKNKLEITAPFNYSKADIREIIQSKQKWILTQVEKLTAIENNPVNKSVNHGSSILFLGKPYTLSISYYQSQKPRVIEQENNIFLQLPSATAGIGTMNPEFVLKQWYVESAGKILADKTAAWAAKIGVSPQRICIKEQRTRWGSCSTRGNINYNWRIIMAPPPVIDYLVIHELCHLLVLNHSSQFWQQVANYLPEFKQHRDWLRINGRLLTGIL